MKGKIARYYSDKQFGFIAVAGRNEDYFFHKQDCINFIPDANSKGMEVEFEGHDDNPKGPRAALVTAQIMFDIRTGTVLDYKDYKSYGFIAANDGITYYFHRTDCLRFSPKDTDSVKFITGSDFLGMKRATCITLQN